MELSEVLRTRRTVRRFTDDDIPDHLLRQVLAAGPAMPHARNTYDWRALVLRRPGRSHPRWTEIHAALLGQAYLAESPLVVVMVVQPRWWADHYPGNVDDLVESGLVEAARHGSLLETLADRPELGAIQPMLVGEAMLAVGAMLLAAVDAGLGAALAASRPDELARALDLPDQVHVCTNGVLALGWPGEQPGRRAAKPELADLVYDGSWGAALQSFESAPAVGELR